VNSSGNIWDFTGIITDPCGDRWQGLVCTVSTTGVPSHITEMILESYNLVGTLPLSVANLTRLEVLDLSQNAVSGTLPASLGSMWNLTVVDVSGNNLQGTLPDGFFNLTKLVSFDGSFNELYGTLPEAIAALTGLEALVLDVNFFSGPMPDGLVKLTQLNTLSLLRNRLVGSLPTALGQLPRLEVLQLSKNHLTGTIPASFGDLDSLTHLRIYHNLLTGTIPPQLGLLPVLQELNLYHNALVGSLPDSLGQLSALRALDVNTNRLTGTINEVALSTLSELSILQLYDNLLTGTIPDFLGSMPALSVLDLSRNPLHGSLPDSLTGLTRLASFSVIANRLSGTIPGYFCTAFPGLQLLYLTGNQLTGTLPECLGAVQSLRFFATDQNHLTGTIPEAIAALPYVELLWLNNNGFTGIIPDLSSAQNLSQLFLDANYLTGTIPDTLGVVDGTSFAALGVGYNMLTGTLPASIGRHAQLFLLAANDNHLTGCVPQSFSQLPRLVELYLQNNHLGCSLQGVFNASVQALLSLVELGGNQLTDALPDEIFKLHKLNGFVGSTNCFTGQLTESICSNVVLLSLILDGLHTSPSCRTVLLPATDSYEVPKAFHGTIPPCLFTMNALSSLHVSGNNLHGTVPATATVSPRLIDFIASHNQLTGTIPASVQSHNWRTLDLSYNRLTGELEPTFGAALQDTSVNTGTTTYNSTYNNVRLKNNRLSGAVPTPLLHLRNVSILGSNMFSCELDKSDLPRHDEDYDTFPCGSNAFNAPFYAVLIVAGTFLGLVGWVIVRRDSLFSSLERAVKRVQSWYLAPQDMPRSLAEVLALIDTVSEIGVCCTALIVVVLVPWYAVASYYFGTYTHQYAWVISAGFLSGMTPLIVEFVLYCALLVALTVIAYVVVRKMDVTDLPQSRAAGRAVPTTVAAKEKVSQLKQFFVYTAFMTVNLIVVGGVNVGFVAIALSQSNGVVFLAQLLLSLFKLLWSTVCTPFLIYLVAGYVSGTASSDSFLTVQVLIGLFNNIAIPCLVVTVLSPNCFYNVFHAPDPVLATFFLENCTLDPNLAGCTFVLSKPFVSSYDPPYHYTYQCSSSFVTYYAPAFVYLGLTAGVGAPLAKAMGLYLFDHSAPGMLREDLLRRVVPRILRPLRINAARDAPQDGSRPDFALTAVYSFAQMIALLWTYYKPVLDANSILVALVAYLGILLTFGVVFPPLAVVMCLTIVSVAWQNKLAVGRFVKVAREAGELGLVDTLERECWGAVSVAKLRKSLFAIICYACSFYALFLFDTLGDAVGPDKAFWVLFVMPALPLVLLCVFRVRRRYYGDEEAHPTGKSIGGEKGLEMAAMATPRSEEDGVEESRTGSSGDVAVGEGSAAATLNQLHTAAGSAQV
jgi:Leucine-rich repeat (LRR) protein